MAGYAAGMAVRFYRHRPPLPIVRAESGYPPSSDRSPAPAPGWHSHQATAGLVVGAAGGDQRRGQRTAPPDSTRDLAPGFKNNVESTEWGS
jgi:hypothetical protein